MGVPVRQHSFAGGELAPEVQGNTRSPHYARGLRTCLNFIPAPRGQLHNRAGLAFVGAVRTNLTDINQVRLVPFIFSDAQSSVLEFGDSYIRFRTGGIKLLISVAPPAWGGGTTYAKGNFVTYSGSYYRSLINGNLGNQPDISPTAWMLDSSYEVATPYSANDLRRLKFSQVGDIITITHRNYAPRYLSRLSATSWLLSTVSFANSEPWIGGTEPAFDSVLWDISPALYNPATAYVVGNRVTYGAFTYICVQNGTGQQPDIKADFWAFDGYSATTTYAEGDYVYKDGLLYISIQPRNYGHAPAANPSWWLPAADSTHQPREWSWVFTFLWKDQYGIARETKKYHGILKPPSGKFPLSADRPAKLSSINAPLGSVGFNYKIYGVRWYRGRDHNLWGWVGDNDSDGTSGGTGFFKDDGREPDYSKQPPFGTNPFNVATGAGVEAPSYPAVVIHHEQRAVFAGSAAFPADAWGSFLGDFEQFNVGKFPVSEDDSFRFKLACERFTDIRSAVSLERLILLAGSGLWSIFGTQGDALTAVTVNTKRHDKHGADWLDPIMVGTRLIYKTARGNTVRAALFDFSANTYVSSDITVQGRHLIDGFEIVEWAYQEYPYSVIWAVRDDGAFLSLTYDVTNPQDPIIAWARHDSAGDTFESLCCVPEEGVTPRADLDGVPEAIYVSILRAPNTRTIERLAHRSAVLAVDAQIESVKFLDSHVAFDGFVNTDPGFTFTVSGASYAAGDTVSILSNQSAFGASLASNEGNDVIIDPGGAAPIRIRINAYTDGFNVAGVLQSALPASLQAVATSNWGLAFRRVDLTIAAGATFFSGAVPHLLGRELHALVDGFVQGPLVQDSQYVYFDPPAFQLVLGLRYDCDGELLDLAPDAVRDHVKSVSHVTLEVVASRGLEVGETFESLTAAKLRTVSDSYGPGELLTQQVLVPIRSTWNTHGRVCFRQSDPLPLTVVAATREVTVGGKG